MSSRIFLSSRSLRSFSLSRVIWASTAFNWSRAVFRSFRRFSALTCRSSEMSRCLCASASAASLSCSSVSFKVDIYGLMYLELAWCHPSRFYYSHMQMQSAALLRGFILGTNFGNRISLSLAPFSRGLSLGRIFELWCVCCYRGVTYGSRKLFPKNFICSSFWIITVTALSTIY